MSKPKPLDDIERLDRELSQRYKEKFVVQSSLNRSLVSFQANKNRPVYRWYKFKEAFSAPLIEHLFAKYEIPKGRILDPFAGSGTALFVASEAGMNADGIELLPIGQQIVATKKLFDAEFAPDDVAALKRWSREKPWKPSEQKIRLLELRITKGAYPEQTHEAIEKYLAASQQENERVRTALFFALLCVVGSVSYTRKDGQYLRWDYRSGRQPGSQPFDKGPIPSFDKAITAKIDEIIYDIEAETQKLGLFPKTNTRGEIWLHNGSTLHSLPTLRDASYDAIITSPPYCNRYDYTRTYALELALLGVGEQELIDLRQEMLSCTVENRAKDLLSINTKWANAIAAADSQELLQAILKYLEAQREQGLLNNNGIPRMVRGYFYEMACVIAECFRVLKSGAPLIMVNDNVRYADAQVSVDMILSDIGEKLGFHVESILVLPNGKGNSSQQMGEHGRVALRKCVYVWRKHFSSVRQSKSEWRMKSGESERRARYAARDVIDKLGIQPGHAVRVVGRGDRNLVERVRAKTGRRLVGGREQANVILYFPKSQEQVTPTLKKLKNHIAPDGGIWVISAKKGGTPYLPDSILIPLGLAAGLVDNKICSVSDEESAMRFVIRRSERQ